MGKLEVGQLWQWRHQPEVFIIVSVTKTRYKYRYVAGTQTGAGFESSISDHKESVTYGMLFRLTPLMEALL
jgi:hypothetical protein